MPVGECSPTESQEQPFGTQTRLPIKRASIEFLSGYFSTHERGDKTRTAYSSDLDQFCKFAGNDFGLLSLGGAVIEQWAAHLREKGYSPASIRRKMVTLRVFCGYWVRKGTLPESPFWRVKLSLGRIEQLPRALTEGEMRKLLAQARSNHLAEMTASGGSASATGSRVSGESTGSGRPNGSGGSKGPASVGERFGRSSSYRYRALRNLAVVDLLFATGMRVGEASALDISDFIVEDGVFRVQGKGGRHRLAYVVDQQTVSIQGQHLEARKHLESDSPALFLNAAGGRLSTQGISNVIASIRRQAGIERHITPHMLRHTVATLLLRNGVDIRVVQEFLGHASIATTQRYTHITKEHMIGVLRERHPSLSLRSADQVFISEIP